MLHLLLAQASPESIYGPLAGTGIMGLMLWWFMTRAEARFKGIEAGMRANENASNRTTRAILMLVISLSETKPATKREAVKAVREIDEAETRREKGDDEHPE